MTEESGTGTAKDYFLYPAGYWNAANFRSGGLRGIVKVSIFRFSCGKPAFFGDLLRILAIKTRAPYLPAATSSGREIDPLPIA